MKKVLLFLLISLMGFLEGFGAERSVVVFLHNNTPYRLYRVNFGTSHGICTTEPPFSIAPNSTFRWETESNGFATGTEGTASYTIINQSQVVKGLVNVHWNNPFIGSNSYDITTPNGFSGGYTGGGGNNSTIHFNFNTNGNTPNFEIINNSLPHIPITSLTLRTEQISSTGNPTFFSIGSKSWELGNLHNTNLTLTAQEHILDVGNSNLMVDDILWLKLEKKGCAANPLGVCIYNGVYGGGDTGGEIKMKKVDLIINNSIYISYTLNENEESNILTSSDNRPFWWKIVQPNKVFEPEDLFVKSLFKTPSFDEVSDSDKWIGAFTTFFFKNKGISGWLDMNPELQHISAVGRVLSNPPLSSDGYCTIDIEIEKIKVGNRYYTPNQIGTRYLRTEFKVTNSASATTIATASSLDSWRNYLQNMKIIPQQNNRVEISGLIKWDTDGGGHYEIHPKNFELDPVVIIPNLTTGYKSAGLAIIEAGTGNGLNAKYFSNPDLSGSFSEKIEAPINIYWPNEHFPALSNTSVRWEGYVEAPVTGTYSFKTITDDGVKLWVDGDNIIDDWGYYGAKLNTGVRTKYLQANQKVSIKMEWRQGGGASAARLIWSRSGPNGFADQMIPSTNLYTAATTTTTCDCGYTLASANQITGQKKGEFIFSSCGVYSITWELKDGNNIIASGTQVPQSGLITFDIPDAVPTGNYILRAYPNGCTGDANSNYEKPFSYEKPTDGGGTGAGTLGPDRTESGQPSDDNASNPFNETEYHAFDNDINTKWLVFNPTGNIGYTFGNDASVIILKYTVTSANDEPARDPKNWTFQGTNDGANWITISTQIDQSFAQRFQTKEYFITNATAYKRYRLNVTANNGASLLQIAEIQMFSGGTITPPQPPTPSGNHCPYKDTQGWHHWNPIENQWKIGQCFAWDAGNNRCVFAHQGSSGLIASFNPNSYANSWDIPSKNDLISFGVPTNNPNIVGCFYPNGSMRVSASSTSLQPDDVTLSPNPNNGIFMVNVISKADKEVELLISNKSGRILTTRKVKLSQGNNSFDFKISEMEGLYILNVVDGNVRFNKQIAKIEE